MPRYTAYWDLLTLGWLPLAGLLMIIDHDWWPIVGLIGGAMYLDASGREAAKTSCFRDQGIRLGTAKQQKVFFASFLVMAVIGFTIIGYALTEIASWL